MVKRPPPAAVTEPAAEQPERKILPTELPKELLRGVPLHVCMEGFAKHWSLSSGDAFFLSQETQDIENFLSHDWGTTRIWKHLTLLMIFNSQAAFVASIMVNLLVTLTSLTLIPRYQLWPSAFGFTTFWLVLLFWQPIRHAFRGPLLVFLDRLCIAQDDAALKQTGILGLATFLLHSKKLTILWSPRYFTRLWCVFEIATFFKAVEMPEIELVPVKSAAIAFLFTIFIHIFTVAWHVLQTALKGRYFLEAVVMSLLILVPIALVSLFWVFHIGLRLVVELEELPEQLNAFRVRDAKCFCCTADHCHPETGEILPCDRRLVFNTLRHWYGTAADDDSFLDQFDELVRKRLTSAVLKRIGRNHVPFRYTFYMLCGGTLQFLPWHAPDWLRGATAIGLSARHGANYVVRGLVEYSGWTVGMLLLSGFALRSFTLGTRLQKFLGRAATSLLLSILILVISVLVNCVFFLSFYFSKHYEIWPIIPLLLMISLTVIIWLPGRFVSP